LEGTVAGTEFTDAGLRHLQGLGLTRLALYGRGFTGQAAAHLDKIKNLRTLLLYDTSVPDDALTDLTEDGSRFSWQRRPCKDRCSHPECRSSR
jgi:hypothetical protein